MIWIDPEKILPTALVVWFQTKQMAGVAALATKPSRKTKQLSTFLSPVADTGCCAFGWYFRRASSRCDSSMTLFHKHLHHQISICFPLDGMSNFWHFSLSLIFQITNECCSVFPNHLQHPGYCWNQSGHATLTTSYRKYELYALSLLLYKCRNWEFTRSC